MELDLEHMSNMSCDFGGDLMLGSGVIVYIVLNHAPILHTVNYCSNICKHDRCVHYVEN